MQAGWAAPKAWQPIIPRAQELPSPAWSTLSMLCGDAASWGKAASPLSRTVVLWRSRIRRISERKPYQWLKPKSCSQSFSMECLRVSADCESVSPLWLTLGLDKQQKWTSLSHLSVQCRTPTASLNREFLYSNYSAERSHLKKKEKEGRSTCQSKEMHVL